MSFIYVPREIDMNVIKIHLNSEEHNARMRLGLSCNMKVYGKCACKTLTDEQLKWDDPIGLQVQEMMAEQAGFDLIEHKNTEPEPEPLDMDEWDMVDDFAIPTSPSKVTPKQRTAINHRPGMFDQRHAMNNQRTAPKRPQNKVGHEAGVAFAKRAERSGKTERTT